MRKLFFITIFLMSGIFLHAQMPVFGADSLLKHYTQKMHQYIDRDDTLNDFYTMDIFGISVYEDAAHKKSGHPEYRVTWQELPIYKNLIATAPRAEAMQIMFAKGDKPFPPDVQKEYSIVPEIINLQPTAKLPLKGLKIALDPGHTASDTAMGRVEDKFILFKTMDETGKDLVTVSLAEGMITWQTANILAGTLRAEGAEVFMTRKTMNTTAFGKTYEQWKKDDYQRTLDSLLNVNPDDVHLKKLKSGKLKDENSMFRYVFRDAELRKRSEIINAFHPDLTIIIHYNVDEKNKPWTQPTNKNFCMTFTGGSFQAGELSDPERRFDFLRLLLTDDIENSSVAAGHAALEFQSELEVPLAKQADATYLTEHCIPAGYPGVFCRNLSLTRMVQGTIIYGETLYQDNSKECLRLSQKGKLSSEGNPPFTAYGRINEVADAYNKAVLDWVKSR
jgi:N-acetylmuramoyl-L-alanine amidase